MLHKILFLITYAAKIRTAEKFVTKYLHICITSSSSFRLKLITAAGCKMQPSIQVQNPEIQILTSTYNAAEKCVSYL
jgi:hypothetical protein